ncbi:hypothetical protein AA313_de0207663 [Arthrobotrys entomopaga]|nr:hypothetical protein AA313_de0207663 [Arthrobotrys entomopaga]
MPCAGPYLPNTTYHSSEQGRPVSNMVRSAHRIRILMHRGVPKHAAIQLGKKRGSAWQPLPDLLTDSCDTIHFLLHEEMDLEATESEGNQ